VQSQAGVRRQDAPSLTEPVADLPQTHRKDPIRNLTHTTLRKCCDAFTVLCDAGRSITAQSMLKAERWARTCTDLAPARYRLLTLAGDLVQAQLCPAHAAAAARAGLPLEPVPVRPGRTARHADTLGHALHMIFIGVSDEDVALALRRRTA
jgi:hypothetical protein